MSKITTTIVATLTALATFTPVARAESNYSDHMVLGDAVRSTGISLKINPMRCWSKAAFGWYYAARNEMVICQENKFKVDVEARWTEEDLDTLRHEAQHLIQDCMDGSRQGVLASVYKEPIELAKSVLGTERIGYILREYSHASNHIKVMELEAFSVALMNVPLEQARDIQTYCF
jgi:hypothetical protein